MNFTLSTKIITITRYEWITVGMYNFFRWLRRIDNPEIIHSSVDVPLPPTIEDRVIFGWDYFFNFDMICPGINVIFYAYIDILPIFRKFLGSRRECIEMSFQKI